MRWSWALARNTCKALAAGIAAVGVFSCSAVFAQSSDSFVTFLDYKKGRSDKVYSEVELGLSTIPKDIRNALLESGFQVVITPTMLTAMPGWEGAQPRGWREDSNYDNVGGVFEPNTQRLLITETIQDRRKPNVYKDNERTVSTTRHEFGHAWDYYQNRASLSDDFVDAYTKDADKLNADQEREFAYFLQPNGAGNTELFAELFAAAYTPNADCDNHFTRLLAAFPKTTAYILKLNPKRAKWEKKAPAPPKAADEAKPGVTLVPTPDLAARSPEDENTLVTRYRRISQLYRQGKLAEVEPLMKTYVRACESSGITGDRMAQTYRSYAALLRQLHRNDEAVKVEARMKLTPAQRVTAALPQMSQFGIAGIKFTIENHECRVDTVFDNTPAKTAGIRHGDIIVAIDGRPLELGADVEDVYDRITGKPGTTRRITIERDGKRFEAVMILAAASTLPNALQNDYARSR